MTTEELLAKYAAGERNFAKADLRGANLTKADLRGADLSKAKLSKINLTSADLRGANLSAADLRGADLTSADLSDANLKGSIFTNANLTGTNLSNTILAVRNYTRKITHTSLHETIKSSGVGDETFTSLGQICLYAQIKVAINPASDAPPTQFVTKHIIDAANNVTLYICVDDAVIKKDYQLGIVAAAKAIKGPLAGYPLRDIAIQVVDGRMHEMDSNALAFEKATELALKNGLMRARPCIVEPIYKVTLYVQSDYSGATIALVNHHEGQTDSMNSDAKNIAIIAQLPYRNFSIFEQDFKKESHSDGQFDAEFHSYAEVRHYVSEQLINKNKTGI
jgi:hypothetical protein